MSRANTSKPARLIGWYTKARVAGSYGNPRSARPNPYRSAVISMPSSAQLGGYARPNPGLGYARPNPGLVSDFDPREFHLQAVVNGVYEGQVSKKFGASFRSANKKQMRVDGEKFARAHDKEAFLADLRKLSGIAFGHSRNLAKDTGLWDAGTTTPSETLAEKSWERYQGEYVGSDRRPRTLDDLMHTRQSYEEMLGLVRKSGFYRVTQEPTKAGARYFVWPMVPGQRVPGPSSISSEEAQEVADKLNQLADPRMTGKWHVPECSYELHELAHWMPPRSAFGLSVAHGSSKAGRGRR